MKPKPLTRHSLAKACNELAGSDGHFAAVLAQYGVPPLWDRPAGFATLLHIILEQQVSLASAKACFDKLERNLGDVTPAALLALDDAELKRIGFSRQKTAYARHLSEAVLERRIDLERLPFMDDAEAATELIKLKGVGQWTADIYLLMALLRPDVMPKGDIALHSAWHRLAGGERPDAQRFIEMAVKWSPHRSTAARLLWHFYLSEKAAKKTN